MKARVDGGPRDATYKNMQRGRPLQQKAAEELHELAGVPLGPCGLSELQKFQDALPNYQIKVLSVDKPHCIIFAGKEGCDKQILLIKVDDHYHGCTTFAGFLSKSYSCHECNHGFDHDTFTMHPCQGKWCPSCRTESCPDFITAKQNSKQAHSLCNRCNRLFFGDRCFNSRLQATRADRALCD